MANKISGCTTYTKRWVVINFTGEAEDVCCARCPLLETYARKQCRSTGEYIMDDRTIGYWCPLAEEPYTNVHLPKDI